MSVVAQLRGYVGFLAGLPGFLRHTITVEDARAALQRRLADREQRFVRIVRDVLLASARGPYARLFQAAGCEPGDVAALVRDSGVEGTLRRLRSSGVYVSFEEFKGRQSLVRNGREIPVRATDFANPFTSAAWVLRTSGSSGPPGYTQTVLEHLGLQAEHRLLAIDAHGLTDAPSAIWRPILPAGSGLNNVLRAARFGRPPLCWFTPADRLSDQGPLMYRLATRIAIGVARLGGAGLPFPNPVSLNDAGVIARWMAAQRDQAGRVWLNTTVSCGVRVADAAVAERINLTGAKFMVAGEPATPAKIGRITKSGAGCFSDYGMTESGRIAIGCARPRLEGDLHLLSDSFAVIAWPRVVPDSDERVNSFHVTALDEHSPTLLLNVEFDDQGVIDEVPCGCDLEKLGLRTHLMNVRSFGRLTGEGVTLVGADLVRIVEDVLPQRFGGSVLDYQMLEEEGDQALTRMTLIVSPRVHASDEALREAVFSALARAGGIAELTGTIWQQAGTLQIRREPPQVTKRGKQPAFRTATVRTVAHRNGR